MVTIVTKKVSETELTELATLVRGAIVPLARQLRQQTSDVVTPTQLSVIGSLSRHGPTTLGDLAGRERLSPPMITKVVSALEELGFVERVPDETDRRVVRAQLSAAGERWLIEARARRNAWLAGRLAELSPDERAVLAAAVPVIERLVDEEAAR